MLNPNTPRKYWDVGEKTVFRPSKDRSQQFLKALLLCDGKIYDQFSLDVHKGEIRLNMKIHEIAVLYRITLPEGQEERFEAIMGCKCLSEPPVLCLN